MTAKDLFGNEVDLQGNWTGGPASDIRAKDAACKFWEKAA